MKYLITESKLNSIIEKSLLNTFPIIKEVKFTEAPVLLGSGERRIIERTYIIITLDAKENLPWGLVHKELEVLREESRKIRRFIENYLIPDLPDYGCPYGVKFIYGKVDYDVTQGFFRKL